MIKKITLTLCLLFTFNLLQAQVDYTFESVEFYDYAFIHNPISVNNGEIWDNLEYEIPIGFPITINDEEYTSVHLTNYGSGGQVFLKNQGNNDEVIIGISLFDLVDRGSNNVSESPISYVLNGAVGNRIFKMQWKNAGFQLPDLADSYINFQLWIHENSGNIQLYYGDVNVSYPELLYNNFNVPITGDAIMLGTVNLVNETINVINVYGDIDNPDVHNITQNPDILSFESLIPNNTLVTFTKNDESIGIEENILDEIKILPNPADNFISLNFDSNKNKIKSVEIYNSLGQKMKEFKTIENQIDVSDFPTGNYIVKVLTDKGIKNKKMIIK
ncbi:T9SS type A sorting domain-containing protein [Aureivirga marina]|uniref:T9SS type A sorting domain-containing protein n=1 Tax=Aureivirga marina TaxID=1182451 RepID=UPI0018C99D31|nr:T9SS type A sorting domain-containing protein [Aureivirga marina]